MGLHNWVQAHGIVQSCLNMAGSVRSRPVIVADPDGQRSYAAFKIRSHRSGEYAELILRSRAYPDYRVASEHVGTDV